MKKRIALALLALLLCLTMGVFAEEAAAPAAEATYTVYVVDQNDEPVPGAFVNFCTDVACMPRQADEAGVIAFDGEPAAYHLQVLMLPEGYSFDATAELYTPEEPGEVTIQVTKD